MTDSSTRREFLQTTGGAMAAMALWPSLSAAGSLSLDAPFNVGLVGGGRQGRAILAELQKISHVNVAAICDIDESRLRSGLRRAKGAEGFSSLAEMMDKTKDLSAVFIATPTHLHREVAVEALAAGKHVYCEAPLASTIDDGRAIVQAARSSGTVFHTGMQGRTNPIYSLAYGFLRSGAIRDMVDYQAQHHHKTSWRTPASTPELEKLRNWRLDPELSIGLAGEFGTHQFDVVHWYTMRYPISVKGSGSVRLYKDGRTVPDTVQCDFTFDDESHLLYSATLANSFAGTYELFCGTMGAIKLAWSHGWLFKEADAPTQGWEVYANRQQFFNEEGITLIANATQLAAQGKLKEGIGLPDPPLFYAIEEFLRSVINGDPVKCSAGEGFRAAVVGIKANEAVMKNAEIAIDPELFG